MNSFRKIICLGCCLSAAVINGVSTAAAEEEVESARARLGAENTTNEVEHQRLRERLVESRVVFQKLLNQSDAEIPQMLLNRSDCVAVLPNVLKAAFVVGGEYGKGVLSCRGVDKSWSAPAFIQIRAASFGWQIGGKSTDLVIFFAGQKTKQLLTTNKFTLGADIGVTAGPVGRKAGGGIGDNLEGVYSYAQSEGIFAGLSLNGAEILPDKDANRLFYPADKDLDSLVLDKMPIATLSMEARAFVESLPE